ncbi:MAG: acyclic terpene utilization AtuA family protein, partial [Comamonadaceae bacterium]
MAGHTVRIGCGSGFWGDTPEGARQLLEGGKLDYLVFDYLAEITMSILARMRERDASQGYATDFVTQVITPYARLMAQQKLKVVVNAGGVNPLGCKAAIEKVLAEQGVALTVAAVTGDDVAGQVRQLQAAGQDVREMFSGAPMPARPVSASAYLGAFPIAAALAAGADIVVTGRCVD